MTCTHPVEAQRAGVARDDTQPGGSVLWIACTQCRQVIHTGPLPYLPPAIRRKKLPVDNPCNTRYNNGTHSRNDKP